MGADQSCCQHETDGVVAEVIESKIVKNGGSSDIDPMDQTNQLEIAPDISSGHHRPPGEEDYVFESPLDSITRKIDQLRHLEPDHEIMRGIQFASRIAEERILYISRFDSTHTSIWQSLECFHSSVQLWCIPLAYLEMQRQVESSSLGIAVGLFSWTYRLVPRCNSHALTLLGTHGQLKSSCLVRSSRLVWAHGAALQEEFLWWVCVCLHISHSKHTCAFWMWHAFIRDARNCSNAASIVLAGVFLLRRSCASFTRPAMFRVSGVFSSLLDFAKRTLLESFLSNPCLLSGRLWYVPSSRGSWRLFSLLPWPTQIQTSDKTMFFLFILEWCCCRSL